MTQHRDFFTPESVDEQIEQFSSHQSDREPAQAETYHNKDFSTKEDEQNVPAHLVKDLQTFYQADYEQNQAFLVRARRRIMAHQFAQHDINQARNTGNSMPAQYLSQERTHIMQSSPSTKPSTSSRLPLYLSALVAVLLIGLFVGTLALGHNHPGGTQTAGKKAASIITPTPTAAPIGTVLHQQTLPAGTGMAWSPDHKRTAVATNDQSNTKTELSIWDVASDKKLKTTSIDAASLGEIQWSPNGQYLALNTLQVIVIVDSQTDAVVNTISYQAPTAFNTISYQAPTAFNVSGTSHSSFLSSKAPLGGGFGFYAVAWTPDGTSLAVSVSDITSGKAVLLDPLTGTVKTTFSAQAAPIGLPLALSDDGKYLAMSYPNKSKTVVWSVATQQVVYVLGNSGTIAWQPGTHNLAHLASNQNPQATSASIELWDVDTQKLIKTYQDQGSSNFAWSPDGKELATTVSIWLSSRPQPQTHTVIILNADTGAQLGSYTSQNNIFSISWSSDGRSIATYEFLDQKPLFVIWTA